MGRSALSRRPRTDDHLRFARFAGRNPGGHILAAPSALLAARGRPTAVMLYGGELWAPNVQAVLRLLRGRISLFIAISRFTARVAERNGIPAHRIRVVHPTGELLFCRLTIVPLGSVRSV
jgi:hypothetical protein